jgi:diacylglycerol kinase family enzyme
MIQFQMAERLILKRPLLASATENLYVPRRPGQKEKLVFICNPAAGNGGAEVLAHKIADFLPSAWTIDFKVSQTAGQEIDLAAQGIRENATIEASVGGDGTRKGVVQGVAEELRSQGKSIGEVAIANVHSGTVGMTDMEDGRIRDPKLIALMIRNGIIRDVDLLRINGHPALIVAGVGFDADRMRRIHPPGQAKMTTGTIPFWIEGAKGLIPYRGVPAQVDVDGQLREMRLVQFWATNTMRSLAGHIMDGHNLADDRKWKAYFIPGGRGWQIVPRVATTYVLRGRSSPLAYCPEVNDYATVEYAEPVDIEVDGQPIGSTNIVDIRHDPETVSYLGPNHRMDMFGQDKNWDYSEGAEMIVFEAAA